MEDNDAKAVSSIDPEDKKNPDSLHSADFSPSHRNYNTRTAALPPQFQGFQ